MDFTLDSLLNSLEAQAGITKQASDDEKSKEDKKEEKAEKEEGDALAKARAELNKADEAHKEEKEAEKKSEKEQTKEAQDKGAALAQEILQKVAGLKIETPDSTKETDMTKQAELAGKALADALLVKLASAGDQNTTNGVTPGVVPLKQVVDSAQIISEDDAKIKPTPGTDGLGNGGSVNQIFDAIIADAQSQGAASYDQVHGQGIAAHEGTAFQHATPNQLPHAEVEKAAAVAALVETGFDFDSAVSMVKEAEAQIQREEAQQVKQAALAQLMAKGVDFDSAVNMVKEAGALVPVKAGMGVGKKLAIGAAAAGAAGLAGYGAKKALETEKKAAFDALVAGGVDFADAAALVASKAKELYGA